MFVMQNEFYNNNGNPNLQTKSVKDTGARGFRKPNSFLVHCDKFVLQRAPIFQIFFYNMQNDKKNNPEIGQTDNGTVSARNARILNQVQESPVLLEFLGQLMDKTRFKELVIQLKGNRVKMKYYHKGRIINSLCPTLQEAMREITSQLPQ